MSNFNSSYPRNEDWPLPPEDLLAICVQSGNVQKVRDYFQECLFRGAAVRPEWKHLRPALLAAQRPMTQLLVTWGARPTPDDLAELRNLRPEQYDENIRTLNLCGLNLARPPHEECAQVAAIKPPDPEGENARMIQAIPVEWLGLLVQLRANGANEAMIAGGALRDLYNGAKVKDVDIFMGHRMFAERFILRAFADAGLTIHKQIIHKGYGQVAKKVTKSTTEQFNKNARGAESWTIIAGPNKTEYNIVVLRGDFGKEIRAAGKSRDRKSAMACMDKVIAQFDIGLCQIATNGEFICTTPAYTVDAEQKKITLTRPNHSSRDHLARVAAKYQDHTLCPAADKLLNPPKKVKKVYHSGGYGYVSRSSKSGYGGFSGY